MSQVVSDDKSFSSDKKFFDDENFPYGIDRSGDFTVRQVKLIQKRGHAYRQLAEGSRIPVTESEKRFVSFAQGQNVAESEDEKLWEHYLKIINKSKLYHSVGLSMGSAPKAITPSLSEDIE